MVINSRNELMDLADCFDVKELFGKEVFLFAGTIAIHYQWVMG